MAVLSLHYTLLVHKLELFSLLVMIMLSTTTTTKAMTKSYDERGCLDKCGTVKIPFPFGASPGCYHSKPFRLVCNTTFTPPKLRFPGSNVSVVGISVESGELRVEARTARDCYTKLGNLTSDSYPYSYTRTHSRFPLSARNKFTAVGCDTVGIIGGNMARYYVTGCVALCNSTADVADGSCTGIGCCQMDIPQGVGDFLTISQSLGGTRNHTLVHAFNPCGFAFVSEAGSYNFSALDLMDLRGRKAFPVVLDWAVGNLTCDQARRNNPSGYACRASNSLCLNAVNGPGYRCKCFPGYEGNPYLVDGCQDINECERSNPCKMSSYCHNLEGSYKCSCPKGFKGDGKLNGTACTPIDHRNNIVPRLSVGLGICAGLLILLVGSSWIYWGAKKRRLIILKEQFFQQNGGLLLQQQLLPHQRRPGDQTAKIFTADELKKATNDFDHRRVVGQGGYGTVYRGVLSDNKVVAIKKSRIGDQSQIEQFINEVVVLSQVNHRNVVKLLGCCLETEVPLLVYEFITNGTLSDHIHAKLDQCRLFTWEMRLKIATETARAIAYLHSSASVPIIHRDVKTANILLDENYTAKVSDFGASRLVPLDQTKLTTLVQGTLGYLDPEYFHTSQLTEKSDVYSFGVVLAEILTGQKALSLDRPESDRNLALYFVSSLKNGHLLQILDEKLVAEENMIRRIQVVADVAKRCLRVRGEERPSMREVASELEVLMHKESHPWERQQDHDFSPEEAELLLKSSNLYSYGGGGCSNTIAGIDSIMFESYHQGR